MNTTNFKKSSFSEEKRKILMTKENAEFGIDILQFIQHIIFLLNNAMLKLKILMINRLPTA